jgi:hypothetical protein
MIYDRQPGAAAAFAAITAVVVVVLLLCVWFALENGSFILAALAVVLLGLVLLGGYETYTLATGLAPPITWVARRSEHRFPLVWMAVVFIVQTFVGMLAGHFFWSTTPPAPFGP